MGHVFYKTLRHGRFLAFAQMIVTSVPIRSSVGMGSAATATFWGAVEISRVRLLPEYKGVAEFKVPCCKRACVDLRHIPSIAGSRSVHPTTAATGWWY